MGVASVHSSGPELIRLLLERGADAKYRTASGKTALHEVAEAHDKERVKSAKLLLEYGADVNAIWTDDPRNELFQDSSMVTPLTLAVRFKDVAMVEFLHERGATEKWLSQTSLERFHMLLRSAV